MSGSELATVAIVSVGNELLYGLTVDTNAAWLGRALADMGYRVARRFTVGDDEVDIQDAVTAAMRVATLIFVSGGLGPTPDDLTKQAVADLFGRDLGVEEGVLADLEDRFRAQGLDDIPPLVRGQADVPHGARVLPNTKGTAPGLLLEESGTRIILLPGVPRELRAVFTEVVRPELLELVGEGASRLEHRIIHTTGILEPDLAELVEAGLAKLSGEALGGNSLAYLPDLLGVDLRITGGAGSPEDGPDRLDRLHATLNAIVKPWSFEAPGGDLAEAVSAELRRGGRTLAIAESCTGGLLAKRMTDYSGASDIFLGGVVAYANEIKVGQLDVSEADIVSFGAVSERVARQLAQGVARRFGVDVGLGITGIAGPKGGTDDKPVGTVWIAVDLDGDVEARHYRFVGDRQAIRDRAAQAALAALYRRLRDL